MVSLILPRDKMDLAKMPNWKDSLMVRRSLWKEMAGYPSFIHADVTSQVDADNCRFRAPAEEPNHLYREHRQR